jgi:hypothetical protein
MTGGGDTGVGAVGWLAMADSSGFVNMFMNLDFLSGLGFAAMASAGEVSAALSLPQFPNKMP